MAPRSGSAGRRRREPSHIQPRTITAASFPAPLVPTPERTRRRRSVPPRAWSAADDAVLRKHYARDGARHCADRLGRSKGSVNARAEQLGLRSMLQRPWAPKEEALLRMRYPRVSPAELARVLRRSLASVRGKLFQMGLTGAKPAGWTPDEIAYLRSHYGRVSNPELAAELGRSTEAVGLKAGRLGLRRPLTRLDEESRRAILRGLGRDPYTELARDHGVSVTTVQTLAHAHGYRARPTSRPWRAEEDAELRRWFPTETNVQLAERLTRTPAAIAQRATALGLVRERPAPRKHVLPLRRWSPADEALLRELHGRVSHREIAERLGRTPHAVASRAHRLGLGRSGAKRR